ncbi:hypothetical protein B0T20DRAFT_418411 [Sordaria brevicollis]|uniref:Uncharacterized protein n=1 Tax=Sordaria brevicollis TaxID=83679 RepID=A0AAE0UA57_SORBR|nr:hypothetical protein B0T20DRAFT_418411 [Sordaria brevicollis]
MPSKHPLFTDTTAVDPTMDHYPQSKPTEVQVHVPKVARTMKLKLVTDVNKVSKPRKFVIRRSRSDPTTPVAVANSQLDSVADAVRASDAKVLKAESTEGQGPKAEAAEALNAKSSAERHQATDAENEWKTVAAAAEWDRLHAKPVQKAPACEHAVHGGQAHLGLVQKDGAHHKVVQGGLVSKAVARPAPVQGSVHQGLVRKDGLHHKVVQGGLVSKAIVRPGVSQHEGPVHHGLVRKDAVNHGLVRKDLVRNKDAVNHGLVRKDVDLVPKDYLYDPKQRTIQNDLARGNLGQQELIRKDGAYYPGLVRKDAVPKDYSNPKGRSQENPARQDLERNDDLVRKDAVHHGLVRKDAVPRGCNPKGHTQKDQVHHGLVRKDAVPKDYNPKDRNQNDVDQAREQEQLLREYEARKDAIRAHGHPALRQAQNVRHEHVAHAAPAHVGPSSHAGTVHTKPTHEASRHAAHEAPRPSTTSKQDHVHNTPSNEAIENAEISALDLIDSYGDQLDPMSFTDSQWDEIMWYQVRYVRNQRRQKRRPSMGVNLMDVFSAGADAASKGASK